MTETLPDRLKIACPQCGSVLQGIIFFRVATEVTDRACPKCHTSWHIVAKVLSARPGAYVHELTWTARSRG